MDKFKIKICGGINCSVRGGQELLDALENNSFLLKNCEFESVNCLKGCEDGDMSPVIEIDGEIHQKMTPERLIDYITNQLESS